MTEPTPVQAAAAEGLRTHEEDGVTVADTEDVLRIARAVVEYRPGLMDRLAR
jgi:hypothetical protein